MARVTSKLQVTVPKSIAQQFAIRPGDEIDWVPAGDGVRVVKRTAEKTAPADLIAKRLRHFDEATRRQKERTETAAEGVSARDWKREDLYDRGRSR
jgi:AbrB family looped-hinge helix DNA binding protein